LLTVPAGYLTLPSRPGWCAAVWLRLRLVRFVKARARAIVEDAIIELANRCWRECGNVGFQGCPCESVILRSSAHPTSPVGSHLVATWGNKGCSDDFQPVFVIEVKC